LRCQLRWPRFQSMSTLWWVLLLVTLSLLLHALVVQRPETLPEWNQQLQVLRESYFSQSESSPLQSISEKNVNKIEIIKSEERDKYINDLVYGDEQNQPMSDAQVVETIDTIVNQPTHKKTTNEPGDKKTANESENKKSSKEAWELLPQRGKGKRPNAYENDEVTNVNWTREISMAREKVYKKRAIQVKKSCRLLRHEGLYQTPLGNIHTNMRWDEENNLIWCPIFKAASTTWVKNFLILAGEMKLKSSLHGEVDEVFAAPQSRKQRMLQLNKSLKMLIVRHPLDRLLSAYRDKMLRFRNPGDAYLGLQLCLVEKYPNPGPNDPDRSNTTANICRAGVDKKLKKQLKKSHGNITHPTFTQFLLLVRDDMRLWIKNPKKIKVNLHWRPYWIQCGPCQVNYDVIMHTESLDIDNEYVIHKAGLEGIIFNAHTHASKFDAYNDTSESTKAYYSQVPPWLLDDIVEFYQPDLTIFGYSAQPYFDIVNS
ncbi:unnamed protein product, partial [Meganyctiphanes norvegica]